MTTITVEVPEYIAKKFTYNQVINYKNLYEELDNNEWNYLDVNMTAEKFLETLENEVLNYKK